MLLKYVKKLFNKNPSIKTRLIVFYSLAIFILICIISIFLFIKLLFVLNNASISFVEEELHTVEYILKQNSKDIKALEQEAHSVPGHFRQDYYYYVRVFNPHTNFLIETQEMSKVFPLKQVKSAVNIKKLYKLRLEGSPYLVLESYIEFKNQQHENETWLIQILLNISYQDKLAKEYRKTIGIALLCGGILSILLSYLIMRQSIRHLHDLTEATRKITCQSLNQRLDPFDWPSELQTLAASFNLMLERIEHSFLRLKQFTGDLAHELLTPINNLIGETEIGLLGNHTIEDNRLLFESNLEELNRISQIIENILFIAQTDSPHYKLQKEKIDIHKEISHIIDFYQALSDEKNIHVSVQGHSCILFNGVMFHRMINNLLSNALKYTLQGSITFVIKELQNLICIEIRDTGIGISSEHLSKLFDRFYRVDSARVQSTGGTGLGLAIVKSIVTLHQGDISISSMQGQGTTILLSFKI